MQSSLKVLYKPIVPIIGRRVTGRTSQPSGAQLDISTSKKFQNPLLLLIRPNVLIILILNATSFSVFFGIVTSLSTLFEETYTFLDEFRVGLCFLSIGGAMVCGTGAIGKCLDWRYQVEKSRLRKRLICTGELEQRLGAEGVKEVDKLPEFPLEQVCSLH
jgi:hypothetical protein